MKKADFDSIISPEEAAAIISKNSGDSITAASIRHLCREYQNDGKKGIRSRKVGNEWLVDKFAAMRYKRSRPGPKPKKR